MFTYFLSISKTRFTIFLLILLLLSGCGQSLVSQTRNITPTSIPTFPISSATPTPLGTSLAFDLGKWLHVQSRPGFTCSFYKNTGDTRGNLTPGTLVLPTVQPTYDQGILQQVKQYVTNSLLAINYGKDNDAPYPAFFQNTNAFQLLAVSGVDIGDSYCDEVLDVTNIGNAPVQISQISAQLTANTQTNNQHYNLVDACSLLSLPCYYQLAGIESQYGADFDLHSGKTNMIIPAALGSGRSQVQAITLKPGEVIKLVLFYRTPDSLLFSLIPSFTLDLPGKQIVYPAPQLQETFAFASASQFSCYALQGQHFTQVSLEDHQHWCI
jgi:hypothetical protein